MYVFGGLDIRDGSWASLWQLDLQTLMIPEDEEYGARSKLFWQRLNPSGNAKESPGKVAYHTSVVWKDCVYIFGGNNPSGTPAPIMDPENEENPTIY